MAPRISLALAIHNHQPVGNFGWVFADVFERAYRPLVEALERHPGVRMALHYTGPLLEWLAAERPEFLLRLASLVGRGQVELLGGGLHEPVLASLPEHDRIAQLRRMAEVVEGIGGIRPAGAWLAERVWEPDLPTSLHAAGYRWTILDDAHFRAAAIPEERLWGPYTTDDQGSLLTVFGTEQGLRYLIPFREVDEVVAHLRDHATDAGDRVGMMGDDGEKFGAWPTTYEHCWGRGRWMERFFDALEANADWLTTVTPSAWLEAHPPIGRVYIPTGSYAEMGEWALPPEESRVYGPLLHRAQAAHAPEARWLRGAFWRNFQVRYREINDLHKQMLRTSGKVALMEEGPARDAATDHLHRGQSNDCYWHGLFGGVYLSHMRLATLEHLIAAEDAADRSLGVVHESELRDLDLDGREEAYLAAPGQVVTVKLDEGAGVGSWDIRPARHALAAVLRRRPEAYHDVLRAYEATQVVAPAGSGTGDPEMDDARAPAAARGRPGAGADASPAPGTSAGVAASLDEDAEPGTTADVGAGTAADAGPGAGTPVSIHDLVRVKEPGLSRRLAYDGYERRSGLVRFLAPEATPEALLDGSAEERGDLRDGPYTLVELGADGIVARREGEVASPAGPQPVRVTKTIRLGGGRLDPTLELEVEVEHRGSAPLECRLGVEWNLNLLGGGGNPSAWYAVRGERGRHDGAGRVDGIDRIAAGNDWVGLAIATTLEPAADAWWMPIETVSTSEAGFERVYQGSCLLASWPARLRPGERRTVRVRHDISVARDRADEEARAGGHAERAGSIVADASSLPGPATGSDASRPSPDRP